MSEFMQQDAETIQWMECHGKEIWEKQPQSIYAKSSKAEVEFARRFLRVWLARRGYLAVLIGALCSMCLAASAGATVFTGTLAITDPSPDTLHFVSPISAFNVTLSAGGSTTVQIATYSLDSRQADKSIGPADIYGDALSAQFAFSSPGVATATATDGQLGDDVFPDGVDTENSVMQLFIAQVTIAFPNGEQLTVTILMPPSGITQPRTANSGTIMATFADTGPTTVATPEPVSMAVFRVLSQTFA